MKNNLSYLAALTAAALLSSLPAARAQTPDTVFLEELTWTEVRDAIQSGTTTIILPTAGTEQNGPHMVLGKHKFIINHTSEKIARRLGKTLVAPVMTYVPEGDLDPPSSHMRFPGTITLPNEHFMKVLEYATRSFRSHGFTDIVLIGDSGPNQPGMNEVSESLNQEWAGEKVRVHFVPEYYSENGFREWLQAQGETPEAIGRHAGITDTAQLMVAAPQHVRDGKRKPGGGFEGSGVIGDPTRASEAYGRKGIELKVEVVVRRVRELIGDQQTSR